jgi:dihydrolipoamide dehydrogenase
MLKRLKKDKIKIVKNTRSHLGKMTLNSGYLAVGNEKYACDLIINGQNRIANFPEIDIEFDSLDEYIKVNEYCQTEYPNIYAIGDVNGIMNFAHAGSTQGLLVVNHIKGIKKPLKINKYPLNMYTLPEVAQIGLTEQEVVKEEIPYKVSEFPLTANGKALAEGNTEGFVRMISDTKLGEVLGIQIIAPNATDMIAEASAYLQVESTVYDVAETIHAHPTISEIFMEVGFEAVDQAIHK